MVPKRNSQVALILTGILLITASNTLTALGSSFPSGYHTYQEQQSMTSFIDVPVDHWAYQYIEALYQAGYVAGCSSDPPMYCPEEIMNRAESAVFIERGIHGAGYIPPLPDRQVFDDVPLGEWYAKWANALWEDGYTAGCGLDPLIYCPLQGHTRVEGSVFFLRMLFGVDYTPPNPVGIFVDVPVDWWGAKWVEAAYNEGLIEPCQIEPEMMFCPDDPLTRALAAYIMVKAKELPLPPPPPPAGGWYQEAGNAQHTGYIEDDVSLPWTFKWQWNGSCSDGRDCRPGDPELGWTFEVPPKSHLVVGNGRLYLPAGEHGVWAISEADGSTAWHNQEIASYCTAAFDPEINALFVAANNGRLYKLNTYDGTIIDSFQASSSLNLAPIIAAGNIHIVSDNGVLYAIDKYSMDLVWSYAANSPGQTPIAYSERFDLVIFGTEDLYVHAVDAIDGSIHWRVKPTVNQPGSFTYNGGDGRNYRAYNYEHGWPVIADRHGIVFIRLHLPKSEIWEVPNPDTANWFPSSNSEIRAFLEARPDLQTLFAIDMSDGSIAFVPVVGTGGIETPDIDNTLGPLPVVKRFSSGEEVVYTIWRNGQKCEAGDCDDPRWDAVMCEMVLDNSTVAGYQAGDCRFVGQDLSLDLVTDEMGKLSMAGDLLFHSHWLASYSYRITERSDSRGSTYQNPIIAEEQHAFVNRASNEPTWVNCQANSSHFCSGWVDTYGDRRVFNNAFWLFFNDSDPPYRACTAPNCVAPYSDGYKARYVIVNNGTIFYEANGGTIIAIGNE